MCLLKKPLFARCWLLILGVAGVVGISMSILAFVPAPNASGLQFSGSRLDGTSIDLSEYRGHVVMLNFWATWCGPCREEMLLLQNAYEQYRDQDFIILAINDEETPAQIQPFVDLLVLTFPIVLDEDARLQRMFGIVGYPTSIFLGRDGSEFATYYGALDSEVLTDYIEAGLASAE